MSAKATTPTQQELQGGHTSKQVCPVIAAKKSPKTIPRKVLIPGHTSKLKVCPPSFQPRPAPTNF